MLDKIYYLLHNHTCLIIDLSFINFAESLGEQQDQI